ncbi:6-bladed beta-propeller [Acanthopleuribacter pedis]|uniref:6-bladed beta-propeller n=1 Tax=Acanthopleuribacter pedis TaxID=442870 RepID=A0A8J7Q2J3_9BACT|nr:6-bladed beta-propeller [Acanthopleuribacter pedis]MBO1318105.1 6-bladed beta-propeller [Acanthopleuribacter pedis]
MYLLCMFLMFQEPTLDVEKRIPIKREISFYPGKMKMHSDGSITMLSESTVFHFDQAGKLIRKFGKHGQNPGELYSPSRVVFNGANYYVTDFNAALQMFDASGAYVNREMGYQVNVDATSKGNVFVTLLKHLKRNEQGHSQRGDVLCKLVDNKLCDENSMFGPISEVNAKVQFRGAQHFVAEDENIHVIGQLEPTIYTYSNDFKPVGKINFSAPDWVQSKKGLPKERTRKAIMGYWNSFSRFYGLWKYNEKEFLVFYMTPDSSTSLGFKSVIARVGLDGTLTKPAFRFDGVFLGPHGSKVYFLEHREDEEEVWPVYTLKGFTWE